ncbi:Zinc carboxypeptidase A 1 [Eumeta japonica]|uniref:Zinc carboxypeptidase A 1 n=1 Tax=Eumeta variegata TaxID=151549 RepID=A0A4C1ZXS9_EUMVA|nr:Zinc carboxypeptidase A 1 [Eumeta japonica]
MFARLLFLSLSIATVAAELYRYDNYTLYRIVPRDENELTVLRDIHRSSHAYEFWKEPSRVDEFTSLVSPSELRSDLEDVFMRNDIDYEISIANIQNVIDEQMESRTKRNADRNFRWDNYQTLEQIYDWFDTLAQEHSSLVSVIVAGQSHEGRDIKGIKISRGGGRKAFVLEGGMAGADWISPVVLTYAADQLIRGDDDEARQAVNDYDWYIFPVTNPDGYEYSHNVVRGWVKNRRQVSNTAVGVDLTKNWNSHWGISGGSFNPAFVNFVGIGPFSEPETRSFSAYIDSISSDLVGYLSFRSFGQRLLIPFAHTADHMYNYQEMVTIGRRAMGSLSVRFGTQYLVGTSSAVHDGATGAAADWVKHRYNLPVVATFQLRDTGTWGYFLPVAQVRPSCEETFDALMAIIREAKFINVL